MPLAFSQLGAARNCVVVAELGDSFLSDASQMRFSQLEALEGVKYWADTSGISTDDLSQAIYEVTCSQVSDFSANSKVVVVEVFRAPRTSDDLPLEQFVSVISDSGR